MTQLRRWCAAAVLGFLCGAAGAVAAQEIYGSVLGTIQDTSGARVPGASVAITNRETNLVLTTVTNESGAYTFSSVLPGTYDVKVTLQGFKEFVQQGVPVTAGSISRVDARLQVGSLSESVTVQSETSLLKTDKADTGSKFGAKEVMDLPLPEFRNYQSLLDLVPGSTPSDFQNAEIDTPARSLQTTLNGTNPNANSTRVDGATNQNTWLPHHTLSVAPAETIAEVNVSTGSFSAEQGLAGGAAITVITKSGTNQLRGVGFGYYTDQRLRSRSYFARRANTPKSPTNHHIDGGTLGGPIVRNKLFFFGAFEGQYRNTEGESIYTVPTEKMRRGDFSEALNTNGSMQLIYDPLTGDVDGRDRQAFAGNVIPTNRINPIAQSINAFYPLPNRPGNSSNFFKEFVSTFKRNNYDVKLNWNRSSIHQIWGKIGLMDATVSNLQKLSFDGGGLGKTKTWVGTVGQTFTPNRSIVIDATVGYSLLDQGGHGPDYGTNFGLELGVPGTNGPDIRQSGMPVWGNGMSAQGSTDSWNPYTRFDPAYTAAANVTKLAGSHTFRFGAAVDRSELNHWQPEIGVGPRGRLDFSGNLAGLRGGQTPNFYNQYGAFLLGLTSQAQKSYQWETMSTREWRYGFYFGDRWQHRNLTLDLGLRYEYFPLVTRAEGRGVEVLDVNSMEVLLGGVAGIPRNVGLKTSKTDFAPRLGVAWRINPRTVARTGYGLTYNPLPFARPLRGFYPLTIANTYVSLNSWQPYGTLQSGIPEFTGPAPGEGRVPLPSATTMRTPDADNVRRGYIQSWNVALERRLPFDMSVNAAYVGTKTTRGFADLELNVSPAGGGEQGRAFFRQFGRTASTLLWGGITKAQYHSLQMQLTRPFKKGLLLRGGYTFGKTMNMADQDGWVGVLYNSPDVFDRNYAPAGFDRRHSFTLAYAYQLPFGGPERDTTFLNALAKGWQLNGTFAAYTGTPFTVTASNVSLDQRGNQQTADLVGELRRISNGVDEPFYDTSAFANVTEQRYGNTGRNQFYGPGYWNYNMSLFRTFPLQGRQRLQFKVEGFSIANNPQFSNPNPSVTSGSFMRITGTRASARNVRVGLRFEF
ncbi:MAG: TonB-dependent receptor [Acidobacteriota bacterium]|nr:TonB-dependent receptor [Acidobacteriota bacterium]